MNSAFSQFLHEFQLPLHSPILIFALILSIILLVPIVFQKIRTPDIIGLILCGVAIGPHGFDVLKQDMFVDIFSTIGLMYIMFLAGLEINLIEFKFNRGKSIAFAMLTFCVPFAIGILVCRYILHLDIYATLLVASIFATHTLVTYPIATKYGITSDASVAIAVGGTILTDSAVLVCLAMILGAHNGQLSLQFWVQLAISLVLFSIFMFAIVPRIAKWFFHRMEEHKNAHYIFVMTVVFLSAFLAEAASLEGIIGAFAAGLALNKYIPNSSALMNRTAFIGNSLFIPFFLISVGMLVDMRVIVSGPTAILVAAALLATAFSGKYIAAKCTQLVFKLAKPQGSLIFGLTSAHAAATLAVVLVGFKAKIVNEDIINAIVIVILVSCVLASFITEHAAKRLVAASGGGDDGTEVDASPTAAVERELGMERILVPVADPDRAENLLHFAVLIKDKESIHPLTVLNVVPNTVEAEKHVALARKAMEEVRAEVAGADVEMDVLATIDPSVTQGIARVSREIAASILLFNWPTRSNSLAGLLKDTDGSGILHHAGKTVFVCDLRRPIAEHTAIYIIAIGRTESTPGFATFVDKMAQLARELTVPIHLRCPDRTQRAMQHYMENKGITLDIDYTEFDQWEDFLVIFRKLEDTDLVVLASGRRRTQADQYALDSMPVKLQKYFPEVSKMLIYP